MPGRRILLIGFIPVLLGGLILFKALRPPIGWQAFEERLRTVFKASGCSVLHNSTEDAATVPLPLFHSWRSLFSWRSSAPIATTGFPDSVVKWIIRHPKGAVLFCLVRYHEGQVACMVIRAGSTAEPDARAMRDEVAKVFPSLKITLDICQPGGASPPLY